MSIINIKFNYYHNHYNFIIIFIFPPHLEQLILYYLLVVYRIGKISRVFNIMIIIYIYIY